jgi:hypothetical protein
VTRPTDPGDPGREDLTAEAASKTADAADSKLGAPAHHHTRAHKQRAAKVSKSQKSDVTSKLESTPSTSPERPVQPEPDPAAAEAAKPRKWDPDALFLKKESP